MLDNILITGGSGRFGKVLKEYFPDAYVPTHKEFDILEPETLTGEFDTIIHLAGYTDVAKAEKEKQKCHDINVVGTSILLQVYPKAKFIFMSSEYCKNPLNYYSLTKLWAEQEVREHSKNYLIIRTLFKEFPYAYENAFVDQYTTGDYIPVIVPMVAKAIISNLNYTIDIGTGRKTMFELARKTQPSIKGISVDDVTDVKLPKDYL